MNMDTTEEAKMKRALERTERCLRDYLDMARDYERQANLTEDYADRRYYRGHAHAMRLVCSDLAANLDGL